MRIRKPVDSEHIKTEIAAKLDAANSTESERTVELVRRIFAFSESMILFKDLLSIVGEIQGVKDKTEITDEEALLHQEKNMSVTNDGLSEIERQEVLKRIWLEILALPPRHRIALLLNLKDKSGDCVIRLFPIPRIASIREIAESLEFPPEEFAAVWNEMPWEGSNPSVN
ncbi:MAG TPA: hypothetical protein VIL74_14855 [Pyrinomonadaceae bacterium]